jgi:hypothetical protein
LSIIVVQNSGRRFVQRLNFNGEYLYTVGDRQSGSGRSEPKKGQGSILAFLLARLGVGAGGEVEQIAHAADMGLFHFTPGEAVYQRVPCSVPRGGSTNPDARTI